ncbi:hypothetical protein Moror_4079 [Moniliophthora roreri MCA 2997]|uniref:Uncharacterized protein n=1 Tax=Moniliophthora roreri (strain MCA 2997) TaxID=1381753 RepID=V2XAJ6_MONRO|nr:hypothetical protein Moror_4079 [Moniliophthora roreri MCA 2997]
MQFKLSALTSTIVTALCISNVVNASALPDVEVVSRKELLDWISTTDAELTFIGEPLDKRAALNTMVVYCNTRTQNVCGGICTVYNGNARCLDAPGTACLRATTNVGFCSSPGCGGTCNQYSTCGTRLDGGFCFTPGTRSINVPFT